MAKKDIHGAAAQGLSVLDTIAQGSVQPVQKVQDVKDAQKVQHVQKEKAEPKKADGRGRPKKAETTRLNLRIPVELRAYLEQKAYDGSSPGHMLTLSEVLWDIVRADMERNGK